MEWTFLLIILKTTNYWFPGEIHCRNVLVAPGCIIRELINLQIEKWSEQKDHYIRYGYYF